MYRLSEEKKMFCLVVGFVVLVLLIWKPGKLGEINNIEKIGKVRNKSMEDSSAGKATETTTNLPQTVRVLIKTNGYTDIFHKEIKVTFKEQGTIIKNENKETLATGSAITITTETMKKEKLDKMQLKSETIEVTNLKRAQGVPVYENILEIQNTDQGLVLIQELDFETYLKGVVPSEMPAKYEMEALKTQAVCARTYAYSQLLGEAAYPEYNAHLDDSVSFQVYGNQGRHESSDKAVDETKGQILTFEGQPICAYYFSTSWGKTTGTEAWLESPCPYLKSVESVYEKEEPWYAWTATIPYTAKDLYEKIKACQQANPTEVLIKKDGKFAEGSIKKFDEIKDMKIGKSGSGGLILDFLIETSKQTIQIKGQHNIRQILASNEMEIIKQDGTKAGAMGLLPSGYFSIKELEKGKDGILKLSGGGLGHGVGMSQNGANNMAKEGQGYEEILQHYYKNVCIKKL